MRALLTVERGGNAFNSTQTPSRMQPNGCNCTTLAFGQTQNGTVLHPIGGKFGEPCVQVVAKSNTQAWATCAGLLKCIRPDAILRFGHDRPARFQCSFRSQRRWSRMAQRISQG